MNLKQFFSHRIVSLTLATTFMMAMSGCSWFSSIDLDITKNWTAQKLYSEARDALNSANWSLARDYYSRLEARYPFGAYAQQAQVEMAYAYFKDSEPATALELLNQFLRAYPTHPSCDYALYLKGLVLLNERDGALGSIIQQDISERDAQAARDAFDTFKELVGRFPESRYAREAEKRMHTLVVAQARHQYNTAKYYFVRKAYVAAINRAKVILTDFQRTSVSNDAMELIADSYHELGLFDLESDMRRTIERNKDRKIEH